MRELSSSLKQVVQVIGLRELRAAVAIAAVHRSAEIAKRPIRDIHEKTFSPVAGKPLKGTETVICSRLTFAPQPSIPT